MSLQDAFPCWHIRKSLTMRETLISDMGRAANRPIVRAVAMAVISNPFAGRYVDDFNRTV